MIRKMRALGYGDFPLLFTYQNYDQFPIYLASTLSKLQQTTANEQEPCLSVPACNPKHPSVGATRLWST